MMYFRQRTIVERVLVVIPVNWETGDEQKERHISQAALTLDEALDTLTEPFAKLSELRNFITEYGEIAGKDPGEEPLEVFAQYVAEVCMAILGFDDGGLLGAAMLQSLQIHEVAV